MGGLAVHRGADGAVLLSCQEDVQEGSQKQIFVTIWLVFSRTLSMDLPSHSGLYHNLTICLQCISYRNVSNEMQEVQNCCICV